MSWFFSISAAIETNGDDVLYVCMALKKKDKANKQKNPWHVLL